MALENCLQVSTTCTRIGALQCHNSTFSSKEKLNLPPTFNKGGSRKTALSFSAFSSRPFGYFKVDTTTTTTSRKSLFVCKAREALDEGISFSYYLPEFVDSSIVLFRNYYPYKLCHLSTR